MGLKIRLTGIVFRDVKAAVKVLGWRRDSTTSQDSAEGALQPAKGEITLLLGKWKDGEAAAFEELMPLVYPHLREVAAAYVRRERNPDAIQGTALVHELYLRLLNQKKANWEDRRHFYTFAAKVMRMILIDHARETQTQMRGGGRERVPLSDDLAWVNIDSPEMLDLNRALDELTALDAEKVQLVELRYFLGCTAEETASLMQVSKATVDRELKFIKSWLYRRIRPGVAADAIGP
jgi:RNA polymerase sigma factor (TIGR02999 family)